MATTVDEEVPVTDTLLLTVEEAADRLRVPKTWLYAATKRGDFPCVRVGRYVRIRTGDIAAFIETGGSPEEDS